MPLRIKCKKCGAVIYKAKTTPYQMDLQPVADILKELNMTCRNCGRKFTDDDIANFQCVITGQPADMKFYQFNAQAITAQKARAKKRNNIEQSYPYLKGRDDIDALDHLVE